MWMFFYDDGTTFSDTEGTPCQAPSKGALVLLQTNEKGNNVLYQRDVAYCWEWRAAGEWVPCDIVGCIDYLLNHTGEYKAVIFGRWTRNINFETILDHAEKVADEKFDKAWTNATDVWREMSRTVK